MILDSLNLAQQKAVCAPLGHQLVLAGAGSGKTRVLIHRFAFLMQTHHLSPHEILAVTFTNKAAKEMRLRLENLLGIQTQTLWIGTFHGLCHRFLRQHAQEAGLPEQFQILDSDDQLRLIRRILLEMNVDENRHAAKSVQTFINSQKEEGKDPEHVHLYDATSDLYQKIYVTYQQHCARIGSIDFADLLLKSCRTLEKNEALRARYHQRFRALLVDEFQDTNRLQYRWLNLLAGKDASMMIVGDDDQSIYGWRGARVENLMRFQQDYPGAELIRLEQNYRSSARILQAANALISQNPDRLGKELWTQGDAGELITVYAAFNEIDEAHFIVNQIRKQYKNNMPYKSMAILYRSNAQSRALENALTQFNIPYRVYGGLRFYDRAEIKDALAYLRLASQTQDDNAFERIINTPTRGIGDRTVQSIRDHARENQCSLWHSLERLLQQKFFSSRTENALLQFIRLIQTMQHYLAQETLPRQIELLLELTQLIEHHAKEKGEKGLARKDNLMELVNAAYQFNQEYDEKDMNPLSAFLAYATLESGEEQASAYEDCVQLMTLHTAKGLEFPIVFLSGCEEELFPHYLSLHDPKALAEERRLCYVGITRAMKKLYLTYAETRRMNGRELYHRPSRFLKEIPQSLIDSVRFQTHIQKVSNTSTSYGNRAYAKPNSFSPKTHFEETSEKFRMGTCVLHDYFGQGTVLSSEGDGDQKKVKVRFKTGEIKVFLANYLKVNE